MKIFRKGVGLGGGGGGRAVGPFSLNFLCLSILNPFNFWEK